MEYHGDEDWQQAEQEIATEARWAHNCEPENFEPFEPEYDL